MIDFDIGVSTEKTYKIKRIDTDFFEEYQFMICKIHEVNETDNPNEIPSIEEDFI